MLIELDNYSKIIENNNKYYYIYDNISKNHVFVTNEIMGYLKKAEESNMEISKFISCFENSEDKEYIKKLISKLKQIGFIKNQEYDKEFKLKKEPIFKSIYIMLTDKCNLSCKHCSSNCSPQGKDILSTYQIKNIILNAKLLNPQNLVITGGEPLVRNDLEEILNFIKEQLPKCKLSLSTNATLINNNNINLIKTFFHKVDISLDGVDEKTCSEIRGPGVFQKVIKNIKLLQENGISNISLSMVFSSKNRNLRTKFLDLNKSLGTNPITRSLIPKGRAYENISMFNIEKTHIPESIPSIYNPKEKISKKIGSCSCNAFESNLFINSDGYAYPCPSLIKYRYKIMNLSTKQYSQDYIVDRIKTISSNFTETLEYKGTKCENCNLNIFCWNCPANFESAKEYLEIDKWCDLMKSNLEKIVWG